jgi:hypothetical protein
MVANSYQNDPAKENSRRKIFEYAHRHLPKDRSDLTALYLASTNDRESVLLDGLGVPRGNRIILEGDPSKVDSVRAANPGVKVIPMTTHDFFRKKARKYGPFGYMGLDYECMLNEKVIDDLRNIADQELVDDSGVMYVNVVGQREQTPQKEAYMEYFVRWLSEGNLGLGKELFGVNLDEISDRAWSELVEEGLIEGVREKFDNVYNYDSSEHVIGLLERRMFSYLPPSKLQKLRSFAMSQTIRNFLIREPPLFLLFDDYACPGTDGIVREETGEDYDCCDSVHEKGQLMVKKLSTLIDQFSETAHEAAKGRLIRSLGSALERNSLDYFRRGGLELFPFVCTHQAHRGYSVSDSKHFHYTSNKNTQMLLDLMKLRKVNPVLRNTFDEMMDMDLAVFYTKSRPYLAKFFDPNKIRGVAIIDKHTRKRTEITAEERWLEILRKESSRNIRFLNDRVGHLRELALSNVHEASHVRKNLGSSFLIPLNRSLARKCVLEGMSDEEISSKYQVSDGGWKSIAAFRANLTMGRIVRPRKPVPREKKQKPAEKKLPGSKFLVSRSKHKSLPEEYRMRIDYFRQEVVEGLSRRKQANLRQSFLDSGLEKLLDPENIIPVRFYAFIDDIEQQVLRGRRVTSDFIKNTYLQIRDAESLVTVVEHERPVLNSSENVEKKGPGDSIKSEVREMILAGFDKEEVWETYKSYFSSRQQFGGCDCLVLSKFSKT